MMGDPSTPSIPSWLKQLRLCHCSVAAIYGNGDGPLSCIPASDAIWELLIPTQISTVCATRKV